MPDQQTSDQSRELKDARYFGTPLAELAQTAIDAPGHLGNSELEFIGRTILAAINTRPTPDLSNVEELVRRLREDDDLSARIEAADTITVLLDRRL